MYWILSHQYFLKQKRKKPIPKKINKILPFWLRHHVSSTNVIIGSFSLYYFSHKEFIRSKEEINTPTKINFLILTAELSMLALSYVHRWLLSQKLRKAKSSRVHQKESVLKQTVFCLFWWRHQATNINVIIGSQIVLHKNFSNKQKKFKFQK